MQCHEMAGKMSCSTLALAGKRTLQCGDTQKHGQTDPRSQLGQAEHGILAFVRGEVLGAGSGRLLTCLREE